MFKFIKQYAETMSNAAIYPLVSLMIFFGFFMLLLVLVKKMRKGHIDHMSQIPLD